MDAIVTVNRVAAPRFCKTDFSGKACPTPLWCPVLPRLREAPAGKLILASDLCRLAAEAGRVLSSFLGWRISNDGFADSAIHDNECCDRHCGGPRALIWPVLYTSADGSLRVFERCGHYSYQDRPHQFAPMVSDLMGGEYQRLSGLIGVTIQKESNILRALKYESKAILANVKVAHGKPLNIRNQKNSCGAWHFQGRIRLARAGKYRILPAKLHYYFGVTYEYQDPE